jgi:ABC-type glycerol-3-phosphate transport system substrate-binding protein
VRAQHRMWRRLLLCLTLLFVSACAGGNRITQPETAVPPANPAEPTVLVFWHAWPYPEQQALNDLVEQYNRTNPTIRIVAQARPVATLNSDLRQAVDEGGGPHMVLLKSHTLGMLAAEGALLPLDDLIDASMLNGLLPQAVEAGRLRDREDGTLLGVPLTFDTVALYFNRNNVLRPPSDTAGLLAAARSLSDDRADPPVYGLAFTLNLDRSIGYLYAFGGKVFNADGELSLGFEGRAGTEAWLTWLRELYRDDLLLAGLDGIVVDQALMNGEALMAIDWASALGNYREIWSDSLGVAPLPRLSEENRPPQPYVQTDVIALNARISSADERASADFLRYMLSSEAQRILLQAGRQPTLLSLELDERTGLDPLLIEAAQAFRATAQYGRPIPNGVDREYIHTTLETMEINVLRGLLEPDQAVLNADTILREYLEP